MIGHTISSAMTALPSDDRVPVIFPFEGMVAM